MKIVTRGLTTAFCLVMLQSQSLAASPGARHGMVVTDQHYASQVGLNVLRQGGNAVDAAVAVGYALAVVDPCCGNIGGGGFMLLRLANGREKFVDFREKAPLAARPNLFLDSLGNVIPGASTKSYLAVGVPGTVAGLEYARNHYGTKSRAALMAPAIALARNGYVLDAGDVRVFDSSLAGLDASPAARAAFTHNGRAYGVGSRLREAQLARTLRAISENGPDAFYRGRIAREIVSASRAHGGILTLRDFSTYRVDESAPVHCRYRG
ncbi:MAG: gamma-glutamyltransferase, partial [Candidatus Eremiobacteraeota bacterium]|nr:gamma-glutamyltransferase [Candidatus Eremiobacteraeota bacterium]